MHRIDNSTATTVLPAPKPAGTPGYFTEGDPATSVPATIVDEDWTNNLQEEICSVIAAAGITLDKTSNTQLLAALRGLGRIKLTAPLNLYVSTTGSDANNGTTPALAVATLQHAWNILLQNYDLNGFTATVNVAPGTYTQGLTAAGAVTGGQGLVTFLGDAVTPSNVNVNVANGSCFTAAPSTTVNVSGFQLTATGIAAGQGAGVYASSAGGHVNVSGPMIFGSCATACMLAVAAGQVFCNGNITVNGAQRAWGQASSNGVFVCGSNTVTLAGGAHWSAGGIEVDSGGTALISGTVFSGAATGPRFSAVLNGVVNTNTGTPNTYLPGDAVGVTSTGGQAN